MTAKKKATASASQSRIRKQLDQISSRVLDFEKSAEKQIKDMIKLSDEARKEQLKKVQSLIQEARRLDSTRIVTQAEKLKKDLEQRTNSGLETFLKRLNIPTRKEVDALKRKITKLEKALKDQQSSPNSGQ